MAQLDVIAMLLSNTYTEESLDGVGALKGVPCQIESKESITGGTRITFLWVSNSGKEYRTVMDVMNGVDGVGEDGKSAYECAVEEGYHLLQASRSPFCISRRLSDQQTDQHLRCSH